MAKPMICEGDLKTKEIKLLHIKTKVTLFFIIPQGGEFSEAYSYR